MPKPTTSAIGTPPPNVTLAVTQPSQQQVNLNEIAAMLATHQQKALPSTAPVAPIPVARNASAVAAATAAANNMNSLYNAILASTMTSLASRLSDADANANSNLLPVVAGSPLQISNHSSVLQIPPPPPPMPPPMNRSTNLLNLLRSKVDPNQTEVPLSAVLTATAAAASVNPVTENGVCSDTKSVSGAFGKLYPGLSYFSAFINKVQYCNDKVVY